MNEAPHIAVAAPLPPARTQRRLAWFWLALPFVAILLAVAWLVATDPLKSFQNGAPPVENLTFLFKKT